MAFSSYPDNLVSGDNITLCRLGIIGKQVSQVVDVTVIAPNKGQLTTRAYVNAPPRDSRLANNSSRATVEVQ